MLLPSFGGKNVTQNHLLECDVVFITFAFLSQISSLFSNRSTYKVFAIGLLVTLVSVSRNRDDYLSSVSPDEAMSALEHCFSILFAMKSPSSQHKH